MKLAALPLLVMACSDHSAGLEADGAVAQRCTFDPPVEVPGFSDATVEHSPTETADLLELWFVTGEAPHEISYARRASVNDPYVVQPLPDFDDAAGDDVDPSITADGLELLFASDRSGAMTLYQLSRTARDQPWSAPTPLPFNFSMFDPPHATMSADGLHVAFSLSPELVDFYRPTPSVDSRPTGDGSMLFDAASPTIDPVHHAIYYNCGASICLRTFHYDPPPTWPEIGPEQPIDMTGIGEAWDPWAAPDTGAVLFGSGHSLYRSTTQHCAS